MVMNENVTPHKFARVLAFVAHPDDEAIGCSGLLQRAATSLVVFATDGAAPYYGFERKFGSLLEYATERFREAARALSPIPNCSFQRLTRPNRTYFQDQHLFQHLPEAFVALCQSVRAFAPDVLLTHAYEGGHIDHDACSFLAAQAATVLGVERLEFPLYWQTVDGRDMFQQFRDHRPGQFALQLSPQELAMKRHMFDAYRSQEKILSVFHSDTDSFRPATGERYDQLPGWPEYPFENRRKRLKAEIFVQKLAEFRREAVAT